MDHDGKTWKLSRRAFLRTSLNSAGAALLAACGAGTTTPQPAATNAALATSPAAGGPAATAVAPAASGGDTIVAWWNKGFYPEEDKAMEKAVADFEAKSGKKIELSFFTTEDLPRKTLSAVEAGAPPDIVFAHLNDWTLTPKFAWEGRLADVSDVIETQKAEYSESALQGVSLQDNAAQKRSYYGIPISQQTTHMFYWKDMLAEAGSSGDKIPADWNGFWQFWKDQQKALQAKGKRVFSMGIPQSTAASDTNFMFHQVLNAYNVKFIDENGKLLFDDPKAVEGVTKALEWQAGLYRDGFVPKGAVTWIDSDNNANFLNRTTLMTPNPTISIPAAKAKEPEAYNNIGTLEWPQTIDGKPQIYMVAVKNAIIFKDGKNVEGAKEFMKYFINPDVLGPYLQGSLGRWVPVMPKLLADPFWKGTSDPHRSVALKQFEGRELMPFPQVYNPAYSTVMSENVWGRALSRIALEDVPPADAAKEAIDRISKIFADWK